MKKYLYLLSTISASLIIGCGDNSSVSDQDYSYDTSSIFGYSQNVTYKNYIVKAVDDPIIHATVTATNCETSEEIGDGEYLLKKCVAKPLYIEIKDGEIKDKNVTQTSPLLLNVSKTGKDDDFIVTPLTTILANASDEDINNLADKLSVSKEDLFDATNKKVKNLLPKVNSIIIASNSGGAITNKMKFLGVVKNEVINKIDSNGSLNVKDVLKDVKKKSINKPQLFGLVIMDDSDINNDDPLKSLSSLQNSNKVKLYGLVFDKSFEANISIKDLDDTNKTFDNIKATSDKNGTWSLTIDENKTKGSLYYTIMNEDVKRAVFDLSIKSWKAYANRLPSIQKAWLKNAKKRELRLAVADSTGVELSGHKFITAVLLMQQQLRPLLKGEKNIGVVLPSSAGGYIGNMALLTLGKTIVNLNYSSGEKSLRHAVDIADITTVVTSRLFLTKLKEKGF
jgi:archaellum biogenesis ATPase FlaH